MLHRGGIDGSRHFFNKDGVVTYGRAGLVTQPENWEWSSADLHIHGKDNLLLKSKPLIEMVNKPWKELLSFDVQKPEIEQFKKNMSGLVGH